MPELIWKGKEQVVNHHLDVPVQTLDRQYDFNCPDGGESDNKIIHGDNLAALKALLPQYEGKVKCIYIDPPYNTGNESWVYNDNVKDPRILKWLGEVVGKEGEDLCRHDKWLCMMYPRLQLLKRLLREDGIMFVSLDDNELCYLGLALDEIFGRNNMIARLIWKGRQHIDSRALSGVSNDHEYILAYAKHPDKARLKGKERDASKYTNPDDDPRGPWMSRSILGLANKQQRPNLHYNLVDATTGFSYPCAENTGWRYSQETMGEKMAEGCIIFPKKRTGRPREKVFLKKLQTETTGLPSIIDGVYTAHGTAEIRAIFGRQVFDFPKPSDLISELIRQASENDSIILDSFAGSGTTAHAVLNLNKRDGGNRKFILIEMMEYAETITAERVKRVINGYGEGSKAVAGTDGDFSYYSLGERVFDDQGNLNEALSVDEIREYVAWSERLPGAESSDNPYWLGAKDQTGYYFFYEPTRATVLNLDFLATLTRQTESYLIYADTCLLDEEFMRRHTIRFKKIPRDISRF